MWISVLEGVGGFPDTRPRVLESSQRPQTHTARSPGSPSWICPHATEVSGWARRRRLHTSELQEVSAPRRQHTARTAAPDPPTGSEGQLQPGSRARTSAPNGHIQDADPRREAPGLGRQPDPAWPQAPALLWSLRERPPQQAGWPLNPQAQASPGGRTLCSASLASPSHWPLPQTGLADA